MDKTHLNFELKKSPTIPIQKETELSKGDINDEANSSSEQISDNIHSSSLSRYDVKNQASESVLHQPIDALQKPLIQLFVSYSGTGYIGSLPIPIDENDTIDDVKLKAIAKHSKNIYI